MEQEGIPEFLLLTKELWTAHGISGRECQADHDPKDGPTPRSICAGEMKLIDLKKNKEDIKLSMGRERELNGSGRRWGSYWGINITKIHCMASSRNY